MSYHSGILLFTKVGYLFDAVFFFGFAKVGVLWFHIDRAYGALMVCRTGTSGTSTMKRILQQFVKMMSLHVLLEIKTQLEGKSKV